MKSKLLMLIISSFVFVGCTVDSKQKYSVVPAGATYQIFYVANNQTGEVKVCKWDYLKKYPNNNIEETYLVCGEAFNTSQIDAATYYPKEQ